MKQILMSKEEYDQLTAELETLKKEKEQLKEENAELNKEVDRLKKMIERGKGNEFMYLNQITTRYSYVDMGLFIDKLKYDAKTYFWKYEKRTDKLVLTEPIMQFFDSVEETFFRSCLKTETEETQYDFAITEQLLYGSLLEAKFTEVSELRWKVFQLKEKIDAISAEKDNALSKHKKLSDDYRRKERDMIDLKQQYSQYRQRLDETIKEKEKLSESNKILSQRVQSLTEEISFCKNYYIKPPLWLMAIIKTLKRDKKDE